MRIALASIGGGVIAVIALVLAGIAMASDDKGTDYSSQLADIQGSLSQIEQSQAGMQESLDKTQVTAAMTALDAAGFHAIDDELQAATEIPAGTAGSITTAHQITQGTAWPGELADPSATLLSTLEEFEAALEAEDLEASKGLATETHDAFHELEHEAYPYIAGEEHAEEDEHSEENGEAEGDHAE
ncbi:MAG: hypothetical protein WD379_01315 [Dehalococcoidia bacterium]